jgi:phosphoglycolate phosphatase-like HAD superfamily hydrolase
MPIEVLLWDFGDTLVDERWMRRAPSGCSEWPDVWTEVMSQFSDAWNVGRIATAEVFAELERRADMTPNEVDAHARDCCRLLTFHPTAWRVANEHRLPQALVTVNPEMFEDYVAAVHGFSEVFDTMVISGAEGIDDKVALCDLALSRLGLDSHRSAAMLIDNRRDLVDAWRHAGGTGCWFQSDEQFNRDLSALFH